MTSKLVSIQLLSDAELAFYQANGFVAPALPLFPEEDVQKLSDLILPIIKRVLVPGQQVEIMNLINKNPDFLDFIAKKDVLDMIEKVIGPDFGLKESSAIPKLAHSKANFKWHSDFNYDEYWEELIKINSVVLMVAVTPSTEESGCVQFVPKTHVVQSKRKHFLPEVHEPEVNVTLARGYCSLHDVHVLHKSEPNITDQDRIMLTFRFFSTDVDGLKPEAIDYLKKTCIGRVHLRGKDKNSVCAHSLVYSI